MWNVSDPPDGQVKQRVETHKLAFLFRKFYQKKNSVFAMNLKTQSVKGKMLPWQPPKDFCHNPSQVCHGKRLRQSTGSIPKFEFLSNSNGKYMWVFECCPQPLKGRLRGSAAHARRPSDAKGHEQWSLLWSLQTHRTSSPEPQYAAAIYANAEHRSERIYSPNSGPRTCGYEAETRGQRTDLPIRALTPSHLCAAAAAFVNSFFHFLSQHLARKKNK